MKWVSIFSKQWSFSINNYYSSNRNWKNNPLSYLPKFLKVIFLNSTFHFRIWICHGELELNPQFNVYGWIDHIYQIAGHICSDFQQDWWNNLDVQYLSNCCRVIENRLKVQRFIDVQDWIIFTWMPQFVYTKMHSSHSNAKLWTGWLTQIFKFIWNIPISPVFV